MLTIAWDVDDILNDLMDCWLEQEWKVEHPECTLTYSDITENSPHKILGVELEEYTASLDQFRLSSAFHDLEPNPAVLEWFKRSGSRAMHIALTAVPMACAQVSAEWVIRNFGNWIRTFHFVPSFRKNVECAPYDSSKSDYLERVSFVDILVEDHAGNARSASDIGVQGLLVSKPWNDSETSIEQTLNLLEARISGEGV